MLNPTGSQAVAQAQTLDDARRTAEQTSTPSWIEALQALLPAECIRSDFQSRAEHSRDRLPFGRFRHRSKKLAGDLPCAVVEPKTSDDVQRVVRFANQHDIQIVPYGSGSGVLGGVVAGTLAAGVARVGCGLRRKKSSTEISLAAAVPRAGAGATDGEGTGS